MSGAARFHAMESWVFDLDNTLYPADTAVMSQVEQRMTLYVMRLLDLDRENARRVQKTYWREYGTTLNGLMSNHDVNMAISSISCTMWITR